jgi:uncharacterized protein (UPF0264 family)
LTKLLVSIRDLEEAETVARHPIGILDVKEPNRGALGAADPALLQDISNDVGGRLPLSFSAGELSEWIGPEHQPLDRQLESRYGSTLVNYDFVKIGLANMSHRPDWCERWHQLFRGLPDSTSAVAVAYFDHLSCDAPVPEQIIDLAAENQNCSTILFDTFHKTGDLFSHIEGNDLAMLIDRARHRGLTTVVAGSISKRCLANVIATGPDYIGVRGAICVGERTGRVNGNLINELLIAMQTPAAI